MDEAARCTRVGFMRHGAIIAEGTPEQLREGLNGRVLELRGSPLKLLRQVSQKEEGVENVRAFGDRLHLRVNEKAAQAVLKHLSAGIKAAGGQVEDLKSVPPALEDVFIALSEQAYE
jgi:ABC-2 type transport system ATP-binding protein